MFDINKLYIGEIGRFEGYSHSAQGTFINYTPLKKVSFYAKQGNLFYDIFTGEPYQILKAGEDIPQNNVGLVEPKKCSEYFSYKLNAKLQQNYMFDIEDLQIVAKEMSSGAVFGEIKIEQILKQKQQDLSM